MVDSWRLFHTTLMSFVEDNGGNFLCVTTELSLIFRRKVGVKTSYLVDRCSFTWINLQTLIVVCSRKLENYSYSKVAKAFPITQIKLIKFNGKIMDYIINDYPRGGKGYEFLWVEARWSKFNNLKCITFC